MFKINLIASLTASIILILISFFVFIKDWRSQVNRYYVYYNTSALGILFTMFLTYAYPSILDITLLNKFTQMFTVIFFASFFAVSLVFPKSESKIPFYKILLLIIPAFIIGAIIINSDLTISKAYFINDELIREFNTFYYVYTIVIVIYLLAGIVNFIRKYIKTKVDVFKVQIRIVFIGVSIALVFAIFSSVILPGVFNYTKIYVLAPSIAAFISAISLFYAVIVYNIMDIRTVLHKTVIYLIFSALIMAPISIIIIMYHYRIWIFYEIPIYLISIIIVFLFIIYSVKIQPLIDKIFKRNSRIYAKIADKKKSEMIDIKNIEEIIKKAADLLYDSFIIKTIFVMLLNKESKKFDLYFKKGKEKNIKSIYIENPIMKWFTRFNDILVIDRIYDYYESFEDITDVVNNIFIPLNIRVILPLFNDKQIIGIICMGEKNNLLRYRNNEVKILREFVNDINYNITNAIDNEEYNQSQFIRGVMDLSSEILSRAVPRNLPKISEISFGAFYIPKYREGIDYFDFLRPTNIGVGVIATDISGRGINNAIYSVILRSAFHSCIEDSHSTFITMQKLNNTLHEYTKGHGGIVKAYYFYFNTNTMRLTFTNAGFQPLEIYRVDKNIFESLDTEGFPLGTEPNTNYGMGRTNLLVGDIGFLYSRALIDSKNNKGENFGLTQLRRIIKENRRNHPSEIAGIIKEEFSSFIGLTTPMADILVIIFKV